MRETLAARYELLDVVGRGGMGVVYRARDKILHRNVAVKVLQADGTDDPSRIPRFEREAKAAGSLNNPHVVAIFDAGHEDGVHYIVMEYVAGQSLAQLIQDAGHVDPDQATGIAVQVADALAAAHASGIIHRDIKPANVMVDRAGCVKVLDFGIARAVDGATLTQAAMVLGSAPYMAPEVIAGARADERSDVYSLGCLLFELLTGRPPFIAELPAAVMHQHSTATPRAASGLNPHVSPTLDALVLSALAKSPDDRPQSAAEFKTRLETSLRPPEPTLIHPASSPPMLPPLGASRRDWRVPAAVVSLLVIAWLMFTVLGSSAGGTATQHHRAAMRAATGRTHKHTAAATTLVTNTTPRPRSSTVVDKARPPLPSTPTVPEALAALSALITRDLQSSTIDTHARPLLGQLQNLLNAPGPSGADHVAHAVSDIEQQLYMLASHGDIQPSAIGPLTVAIYNLRSAANAAGSTEAKPVPPPAHDNPRKGPDQGDDSGH